MIIRYVYICVCVQTGLTPLMEAASGGYVEVGRVLLDKGADIAAAPVPVSRDTALTIAADKGHHRFVELLLTRYVTSSPGMLLLKSLVIISTFVFVLTDLHSMSALLVNNNLWILLSG